MTDCTKKNFFDEIANFKSTEDVTALKEIQTMSEKFAILLQAVCDNPYANSGVFKDMSTYIDKILATYIGSVDTYKLLDLINPDMRNNGKTEGIMFNRNNSCRPNVVLNDDINDISVSQCSFLTLKEYAVKWFNFNDTLSDNDLYYIGDQFEDYEEFNKEYNPENLFNVLSLLASIQNSIESMNSQMYCFLEKELLEELPLTSTQINTEDMYDAVTSIISFLKCKYELIDFNSIYKNIDILYQNLYSLMKNMNFISYETLQCLNELLFTKNVFISDYKNIFSSYLYRSDFEEEEEEEILYNFALDYVLLTKAYIILINGNLIFDKSIYVIDSFMDYLKEESIVNNCQNNLRINILKEKIIEINNGINEKIETKIRNIRNDSVNKTDEYKKSFYGHIDMAIGNYIYQIQEKRKVTQPEEK